MSIQIYIASDLRAAPVLRYTFQLLAFNKGVTFQYVTQASDADLAISDTETSSIPICAAFYDLLASQDFKSLKTLANGSYHFFNKDGKKDLLAAIFYLVNCLQEYHTETYDQYGRFPFADSIQRKENLLQKNVVQHLIDEFWQSQPLLSKMPTSARRSAFFLTHDIDTVYGAKNQNGDHALKTHQYHKIPALLWNHYLGKPDWINMDKIIAIEQSYGFKSCFYWLVNKDKENADYDITEPIIQQQLKTIQHNGSEIGLHKSRRSNSFAEELAKLNTASIGQRYHFLRFNLPQAWADMEQAGLKLDTSLGFSEGFGFRNSYGLPFMPYNIAENRVYDLIEVPMQVMDATLFYQNISLPEAEKMLIDWFDANKYNCVFTVNFHNNFFDQMLYRGYDGLYRVILSYFKENGLQRMLQADLIKEFYKPELFL
jgi:hypothetical protein